VAAVYVGVDRLPVWPDDHLLAPPAPGQGQPIRADGPQSIQEGGTPTMGGLMIIAGVVGSCLLWADLSSVYVVAVLLVTLGFGAIGFYDDYLKVTKQSDKGFSGRRGLESKFLIACIAVYFIDALGAHVRIG